MTGDYLLAAALFAAGYAVSIFTWPWLRHKATGAEPEIERLKVRMHKIMNAIRE